MAGRLVLFQVDLFMFDAAPNALDDHVVAPASRAVHREPLASVQHGLTISSVTATRCARTLRLAQPTSVRYTRPRAIGLQVVPCHHLIVPGDLHAP
ncbi:hypothetical protein WJ52_00395 [Burkholderia ubonensis]|nr:hypothetical protein WJ51_31330 [Burkholderia ubonensis]KVM20765.1 hypothetical protein WJ52_00395 [Burkholderia ubonensis]KVX92934.1 hypothetical protein WL08_26175 [Burkholderia ubonensis]